MSSNSITTVIPASITRPLFEGEVLEQEYEAIHGRLPDGYLAARDARLKCKERDFEIDKTLRQELITRIHADAKQNKGRAALCLSGGGIRSATFALGVLQGLAKHDLLGCFHYLSTVSGGGYIGSWLSAWIHRHPSGSSGVLNDLKRSAGGPSSAFPTRPPSDLQVRSVNDNEPDELRHLRDYSNYLTPDMGLLRPDGWTLAATYLRNLLLNWMVLLPLIAMILMLPHVYMSALFVNPSELSRHPSWVYWGLKIVGVILPSLLALVALVVCLPSVSRPLPTKPAPVWPATSDDVNDPRKRRATQAQVIRWVVVPTFLSCVALALFRCWFPPKHVQSAKDNLPILLGTCAGYYGLAAIVAMIVMRVKKKPNPIPWWRLLTALLVAGALTALVHSVMRIQPPFARLNPDMPVLWRACYVCFSVPANLTTYMLLLTLYVGVTSGQAGGDDDREWLARVMGWMLMIAGIWVVVTAVSILGPITVNSWLIEQGHYKLTGWGTTVSVVSALSGIIGLKGGLSELSSARNRKNPNTVTARILQLIPHLAAMIAVAAILLVVAWGLSALCRALVGYDFTEDHYGPTTVGRFFLICAFTVCLGAIGWLFGRNMNMNRLSLHGMYRDRLVRAFLGASNATRAADPFTGFDPADNIPMHHLRRHQHFIGNDLVDDLPGNPDLARPKAVKNLGRLKSLARCLTKDQRFSCCILDANPRQIKILTDALTRLRDAEKSQTGPNSMELGDVKKWIDALATPLLEALNTVVGSPNLLFSTGYHLEASRMGAPEIDRAYQQLLHDGCPNLLNRLILERELRSLPGKDPETESERAESRTADNTIALLQPPAGRPNVPWPFHVVNVALNLVEGNTLAWQERKATSFTVSPLHCGYPKGYRQTVEFGGSIKLGTAMTISGAAATPNMGYHSSPAVTFLMTLFNVRLGWWLGNPAAVADGLWRRLKAAVFPRANEPAYRRQDPRHSLVPLIYEAMGRTNDDYSYVYLSDGGHFENLGLYEMVKRRCHYIVVSDATFDPRCEFEDLGNAIRKIQIDMGIPIEIDKILFYPKTKKVRQGRYCAVGRIRYTAVDGKTAEDGRLLYFKPARHDDEPVDVYNHGQTNHFFPHEPTANQWFGESQFESYRKLGMKTVTSLFEPSVAVGQTADQDTTSLGQLFSRANSEVNRRAAERSGSESAKAGAATASPPPIPAEAGATGSVVAPPTTPPADQIDRRIDSGTSDTELSHGKDGSAPAVEAATPATETAKTPDDEIGLSDQQFVKELGSLLRRFAPSNSTETESPNTSPANRHFNKAPKRKKGRRRRHSPPK